MSQLLTTAEACERLSMSRANVCKLLASGELSSVKIGRLRRIPEAALEEFIARLVAKQGA